MPPSIKRSSTNGGASPAKAPAAAATAAAGQPPPPVALPRGIVGVDASSLTGDAETDAAIEEATGEGGAWAVVGARREKAKSE